MPEALFDLLRDPLLSIDVNGESERVDLPTLLECLGDNDKVEFAAIQPHQQQGWHAFLVQIAAMALRDAGGADPAQGASTWREHLRGLAGGDDAAWHLVVDDLARPAFMQPPVPEGTLVKFKPPVSTPSAIDVLVTSKNHDVKMHRIVKPEPEHWVYALVALQTMQGFLGAGNYGIARMNGGFGSRASVSFTPGLDTGPRYRRDVGALCEARDSIVSKHGFAASGGFELLWTVPWDGSDSLSLIECDPYFVEVCRRLRMVVNDGDLQARTRPTKAARVAAKDALGDVGDPWLPVNIATGKALTIPAAGLGYRRLRDLLFSADWSHGAAGVMRQADGPTPDFVASVMVRGQGETGGLLERVLPIPRPVRALLRTTDGRDRLDVISRQCIEAASEIQKKVLYPALRQLFDGAPDEEDLTREWIHQHDDAVNRVFFDHLWRLIEDEAQDTLAWDQALIEMAGAVLERAIESTPLPSARRHRLIAHGENVLAATARKHLGRFNPQQEGAV